NGTEAVGQVLRLRGLDDEHEGFEFTFDGTQYDELAAGVYRPGDRVFAQGNVGPDGETTYYIINRERTGAILWLALLFAALVVAIGRLKGLRALVVLAMTFVVILKLIVPLTLQGYSPLPVALIGGVLILGLAVYVTEGWNRASHLAVAAVTVVLAATGLLSSAFIGLAHLTGLESEDALFLLTSGSGTIDMRGLLLVGIIIGTLGVLDDVVISQISVIKELKQANPSASLRTIYNQARSVGVSHLSSMVNTLFLTYAGASLPLLLLFSVNGLAPLGFRQAVSNEMLATEIVRTLVGSIGLVLAVPVSTWLAVRFLPSKRD
ncbi:MAG: YibE/F family protein, partial [bacterium]